MDLQLLFYVGVIFVLSVSGVLYWLDKLRDYQWQRLNQQLTQRRLTTIAEGRKEIR